MLIQSGLSEAWWPLAMTHWIAIWNGFVVGDDGKTPYYRRFGEHAPYKQYPFGALVLLHPHRPVPQSGSEPAYEKMRTRLVPAVLVEVTMAPAGRWGDCYGVVPLIFFTSETRGAKAAIRRSCDIIFPERVSFPLKARLMLHGAVEDKTLPEPHVTDDGESWEVVEDRSQFEEVAVFADGHNRENAASFEREATVAYILVLEPDGDDSDCEDVELAEVEPEEGFPPIDADLIEHQVRRDALQHETVAVRGGIISYESYCPNLGGTELF